MSDRSLYYLGAGIGGTIGSLIPLLWGASAWSGTAMLVSGLGGLAGIWAMYQLVHR